jgi:Ca2+-dependent lipid-binding protein
MQTKYKTLNPKWNQTFSFLVKDPTSERLTLQLMDRDKVGSKKVMLPSVQLASSLYFPLQAGPLY